MIQFFERKVRLTDIEVWDVNIASHRYMLAIVDEHRPATREDFHSPDVLDEDLQRANVIVATFYSDTIDPAHTEALVAFAHMLTDHVALAHCEVVVHFVEANSEQAIDDMLRAKLGYTLDDIPLHKARHFHQQ